MRPRPCRVSIVSNEPDNGLGDGDTTGDIQARRSERTTGRFLCARSGRDWRRPDIHRHLPRQRRILQRQPGNHESRRAPLSGAADAKSRSDLSPQRWRIGSLTPKNQRWAVHRLFTGDVRCLLCLLRTPSASDPRCSNWVVGDRGSRCDAWCGNRAPRSSFVARLEQSAAAQPGAAGGRMI